MARGFKTGGRKKGSKNKKKGLADLKTEVVVQSAQTSETPLEYMLRVMRDPMHPNQRRDEMARAAAPYVHAKLLAAKMEHKQEREMTAAEALEDLVSILVRNGVQIALPPGQTIEGEAETIGVARIDEQGAQGDKIGRCAPRPMRRARP